MLDDDIQYLGSRIKLRDPPRYMQRTVSGIALHIEKSDGNEAYVLTFNREKSSTVHVGRRPGNENESRTLDQENGRAMFRCAVVSRRHAKIVFTDSGNVFLIDLDSHHGTHIRKPGETSSRILEPEIPTPLSDGDIITFGKTVGKNEEMVRPIVARLQLLHSGPSTSTIKPLVVPDTSANRSHSGRYGLHSPSSSSSDEAYYGQSDAYSDIEEIPPPAPVAPVAPPQTESQSKTESHFGRAFEVIKRLLPPTSIPPVPVVHSQCDVSPRLEEQSPIQSESSSSSAIPRSDLPPLWTMPTRQSSPFPLLPRYPSISSVDFADPFFDLPPINTGNIINVIDLSRSESPMDLASPSPPPQVQIGNIIGAWNDFSSPSSSESDPVATPPDDEVPAVNDAAETPVVAVNTAVVQHEENHEAGPSTRNEDTPSSSSAAIDKGKQKEQNPAVDDSLFVSKTEYEDLKTKYSDIQTEIDILQAQRRKYKSKFNTNVHTVTDKFHELEEKMNEMAAQCTLFMDQIEGVTSGDIPDIQARIDDLVDENDLHQTSIDELKQRLESCEDKNEERDEVEFWEVERMREEKETAQKYLDTLKGLIDEMKTLRATTEREIQAELETLRKLRESIHRDGVPSSPTKRKRTLDDEGDRDGGTINTTTPHLHNEEDTTPASSDNVKLQSIDRKTPIRSHCSIEFQIPHDQPSPRKRVRRIASVAVQTATAVTTGAVLAWTALAFF